MAPTAQQAVAAFAVAEARKIHARHTERGWIAEGVKSNRIAAAGFSPDPWTALLEAEAAIAAGEARESRAAQVEALDKFKVGDLERRTRTAQGPVGEIEEVYFIARRADGSEAEAASPEDAVAEAKKPRANGPR